MSKFKRIARYLLSHPRVSVEFRACDSADDEVINVYSDSDWAGCKKTRKSTSGGAMVASGGLVKTWSSTQSIVAQSSGEAEYYAMVRAAAEGLGMQSIMSDLGWYPTIHLWVDSSAAKAMASRTGLGKVRHMEVKFLWLQQALRDKKFRLYKIDGKLNPADVGTKPHSWAEMSPLLRRIGVDIEEERNDDKVVNYLKKVQGKKKSWADELDAEQEN